MTDRHPFEAVIERMAEGMRELVMNVTDEQLAEMQPHERRYILANRAALRAFDRGDAAELDRLALEELDALRTALRKFT